MNRLYEFAQKQLEDKWNELTEWMNTNSGALTNEQADEYIKLAKKYNEMHKAHINGVYVSFSAPEKEE